MSFVGTLETQGILILWVFCGPSTDFGTKFHTLMEAGKFELCKSELPVLQPSPSFPHKGDPQQSCTESSVLNKDKPMQKKGHNKKKKFKNPTHALKRLW